MIIRNISNKEFEKIQSLINNCGEYVTTYHLYTYWILSNYFNKTCNVAEDKEKIIGFISGLPVIENKIIFIWQLCIRDKYRNKGIAFKLIDNIVKEASPSPRIDIFSREKRKEFDQYGNQTDWIQKRHST